MQDKNRNNHTASQQQQQQQALNAFNSTNSQKQRMSNQLMFNNPAMSPTLLSNHLQPSNSPHLMASRQTNSPTASVSMPANQPLRPPVMMNTRPPAIMSRFHQELLFIKELEKKILNPDTSAQERAIAMAKKSELEIRITQQMQQMNMGRGGGVNNTIPQNTNAYPMQSAPRMTKIGMAQPSAMRPPNNINMYQGSPTTAPQKLSRPTINPAAVTIAPIFAHHLPFSSKFFDNPSFYHPSDPPPATPQSILKPRSIDPRKDLNLNYEVKDSKKRKIQHLLKRIDSSFVLDVDTEEMLLKMADEFIDQVTFRACQIAKHRKSNLVQDKDVHLELERNWDTKLPGNYMGNNAGFKKHSLQSQHSSRLALVHKSKRESSAFYTKSGLINEKKSLPLTDLDSLSTPVQVLDGLEEEEDDLSL